MYPRRSRNHLAIWLLAVLAGLTGCAAAPGPDGGGSDQPGRSETRGEPLQDDPGGLLARAAAAPPAQAAALRLQAAMGLAQRNDFQTVAGILRAINPAYLERADQGRLALLQAQLALDAGDPSRALARLESAPAHRSTTRRELALGSRIRARVLEANHRYLEAARERIYLNGLLPAGDRASNRRHIWADLVQLSPETLEAARSAVGGTPELGGWIELARVARGLYPTLEAQQEDVAAWRRRWPDHPANGAMPERLARLPGLIAERPRHLALLLPLSGPLASAGEAVRDGFMTAHLQALESGGATPRITILDSHATSVRDAYFRALDQGAEMVIGPLSKAAVDDLAAMPSPEVPILALNTGTSGKPIEGIVQFALLPEDEGVQIARRLDGDGAERVLVLRRLAPWSDRLHDAFSRTFVDLGGEVVDAIGFSATSAIGEAVAEAMLIGESEARMREMRRTLGTNLEFVPRRRDDLDAVVAITDTEGGRTLKPALDYYFAGDLPVYASSHINDGETGSGGAGGEAPLDGIRFCDMPWRLLPLPSRRRVSAAWPETAREQAAFHALGVDAWRLHAQLPALRDGQARYSGVTGELHLEADGRLHRELLWALIRAGRPLPMPRVLPAAGR